MLTRVWRILVDDYRLSVTAARLIGFELKLALGCSAAVAIVQALPIPGAYKLLLNFAILAAVLSMIAIKTIRAMSRPPDSR